GCIPKHKRCTWSGPKCCNNISCHCNISGTLCKCRPGLFGW
uniref:Toxin CSTX-17 n=2 Tax=Cupiennius salei TaxID=6928 RepID=TX20A_CUPSA|nr:RecName: Full=Toxin CSTX-17 [Cupiennius salei]